MNASYVAADSPKQPVKANGRIIHRARRGLSGNLIVALANQGAVFLTGLIAARLLGTVDFGKFAIIQSTIISLSMVAQSGTGYTAAKYVSEYRALDPLRASRIINLCASAAIVSAAIFSALLLVFAPVAARAGFHRPELSTPLRIGAMVLFFTSVNGYQSGALAGLEAFHGLAATSVVSGAIAIALVGIGTHLWGVNGTLYALAVAGAFRCLVTSRVLRAEIRRQGMSLKSGYLHLDYAILVRFALPVILAGYFSSLMVWTANTILIREAGYIAMALYTAALNVKAIALFVPINVVNLVSTSLLNNIRSTGDTPQYERWFRRNAIAMVTATLVVAALMVPLGRPILGLFGKDFRLGRNILLVSLCAAVIESAGASLYQLIQNHGKMWQSLLVITIPRDSIMLVAAIVLIPSMGAMGLVTASSGASLLGFLLTAFLARKIWRHRLRRPKFTGAECEIEVEKA